MSYIYAADLWCDDCGESIRNDIIAEGNAPADPDDECSYDSDEFPKGCDGTSEADCPNHCGAHEDCINAITLSDGTKIGVWLENDLTTDGEDYVKEAVKEGGEVAELWAEYYDYLDFEGESEDDGDDGVTDVVFLREQDNDNIFAIFPALAACVSRTDLMTCYAHIGQHGSASFDYCYGCDEVTDPAEYAGLFDELQRRGYELYVISKDRMTDSEYNDSRKQQVGR